MGMEDSVSVGEGHALAASFHALEESFIANRRVRLCHGDRGHLILHVEPDHPLNPWSEVGEDKSAEGIPARWHEEEGMRARRSPLHLLPLRPISPCSFSSN
eukprot:764953-Hanusia_phi.AAC.1